MKTALITISTESHMAQSVAMLRSAVKYSPDIAPYILLVEQTVDKQFWQKLFTDMCILSFDDLEDKTGNALFQKYGAGSNELRWSLKPLALKYLIRNSFENALYADNDLHFFASTSFLQSDLNLYSILLFPHWRISNPNTDADWFSTNFTDGVYNAGFIGVNKNAASFLDWWAGCCLYKCERNHCSGFHDDQRYLDLVPTLFDTVKINQHKGCNVAYWNIRTLQKQILKDALVIDLNYPLIFAHFTHDYIRVLLQGEDPLMLPYLQTAQNAISYTRSIIEQV